MQRRYWYQAGAFLLLLIAAPLQSKKKDITTKAESKKTLETKHFVRDSQNVKNDSQWPVNVEMYGSARLDMRVDSRQVESFRDSLELLYPKERCPEINTPLSCNECLPDSNAVGDFGLNPAISRFGFTITGADDVLCEAKVKGFIEGDFYGRSDANVGGYRLRHAFATLDWKDIGALVGYTWHPFCNPATIPNTISFNSGEPMVPICRVPQLQLSINLLKNLSLVSTAYSEFEFTDDGPSGYNHIYIQNAQRPGFNCLLLAKFPKFLCGIGIDNHEIMPRLRTSTNTPDNHEISSFVGSIFSRILYKKLVIRGQVTAGGNSTFLTQIGGYAVKKIFPDGQQSYTNIHYWGWGIDCDWNLSSRFQPGIYFGRTQNTGANSCSVYLDPLNDNKPIFYGIDSRLDFIYRISPRLWIYHKNIHFGFELEYTKAGFGPMQNDGKIKQVDTAEHFRVCAIAIYSF